jgi:outer membrane receptor protein involved in Fe transport
MKTSELLGTVALRSVIVGLCGVLAQPAAAQVAGPPEVVVPGQAEEASREATLDNEPVARNADGSESQGGTITVTGTRIRLPNLESLEPTITLDSRQVRERNFTNVADALNELPGMRGSITPAGAQTRYGQGVNFVNNYGLGSNRTLTLINGRRFVTSSVATLQPLANAAGTQVDLNVVPTILLDRVDLVSIGGAPVYGSDAIAGTVNLILRSRYDGVELTALSGITEEGDNFKWNVSALAGRNFLNGRANLTFAVSHDDVRGVAFKDRANLRNFVTTVNNPSAAEAAILRPGGAGPNADFRLNPAFGFNNSPNDMIPGAVYAQNVTIPAATIGGLITAQISGAGVYSGNNLAANDPRNPAVILSSRTGGLLPTTNALQFNKNGELVPFNQGILFRGLNATGGEGFTANEFNQITGDLRRSIFNGFFTFEVTPNIEFFVEGTHFRSRADELIEQPTFNSNAFAPPQAQLTYSVNNPFLTPQARDQLVARGITTFQVSRLSTDLADLTGYNKTRISRGVGGFRGGFQAFGRQMNWEAYANFGETKSTDFGQNVNEQKFVNAVNVTRNAAGQIVCDANPAIQATLTGRPVADPNCVPLNMFGEGVGSAAARAYVLVDTTVRSRQRQTVYSANLGGSLFDIWGGPVGFNVGYEHREESARFVPDEFLRQPLGRVPAVPVVQGKYNLDEVFGEVLIPLVSPDTGLAFLHSAQVYGRGRYVDSTVNGGFFSWAVGGTIAPVRDIEFRGNFTRSFRAPAITELFLPVVNTSALVPDICSPATRNGGPTPEVRARNCAAFLAAFPNASPDPAAVATVPVVAGGNARLENERADSYTFGAILRPRFLPRFSATADYISITLDQPITTLSIPGILSSCFDNPDFDAGNVLNANRFCSRVARDATTGRVSGSSTNPAVRTGFVNGVQVKFRGIQGTMNYTLPLSGLGLPGRLDFGGDMLYVKKRLNNITGVAPARSDGTIGDPEFSGQLRIRYTEEEWGINTTLNYTGEQLFSRFNRDPGPGSGLDAREIDKLDDFVTLSGGLFFDPTKDFRFTLAVTNLFNRQGQKYFGALIGNYNDLLGRRFSASARIRF